MVIKETTVKEYNKQALDVRNKYMELLSRVNNNYDKYYRDVSLLSNLAANVLYLLTK